jgi:hypothetical protein
MEGCQMTVYKVRDPSGQVREIEGPEGATDEQIIEQAQKLFAPEQPAHKFATETQKPKTFWNEFVSDLVPGKGIVEGNKALERLGYRAGGVVTDVASKALPPEAAAGLGYAANVALQAVPMFLGGSAGAKTAPVMEGQAAKMMQSALKPAKTELLNGKAAEAIKTMLDEGFVVTQGSVERMRKLVGVLDDEVKAAIKASPAVVNKNQAATSMQLAVDKFSRQVNPKSDLGTIYKAWNEFLSHPLLTGKADMPVQLAQELKTGTYKALGTKSYGELKGAEIEAQKMLAHGLREEISKVVPSVAKLNEREGKVINAMLMNEARVLVNNNRDPGGLAYLVNNPQVALGYLAARSSAIKSLLAQGMYHGAKQAKTVGQVAGATYGSHVIGEEGP